MTPRIPENVFTWFADWGPVTIMVNTMPPRDPNDDDDEEEEDEEDGSSLDPTRTSAAERRLLCWHPPIGGWDAPSIQNNSKRLTAFCAITVVLLGEAAAEERPERIDLNRFTCKQFLELNRDDALIVVGWLQGYHLDEHAPPVVDFAKLSVESVSLANRCVARPDEDVMTAAEQVFGK